jgi:beta-alanine--pyruvate transaminase
MHGRVNSLEAFWMPFSNNRAFKEHPRMFVRAKDMHYYTPDGREVLDGTSGLWCVNAGHCRAPIVEAIQRQGAEMDFAPAFHLGHPKAFELAHRVASLLPEGLDHVFFCNSGSEAVDTALKIALAYQKSIGQGARTRLIGRERGYHGVGFGGISVGGIGPNRRHWGPLLPGVDHMRHTHDPASGTFVHGQRETGAELADDLERIVALHGADTIAAVIVEPMAGSTGVLIPPKAYLQRLRDIATKHGIVLIFDEVITGFGRLGAATASEYFGVTPDLITMAKGITNATVPMGAVGVRGEIYEAVLAASPPGIDFFHGYTYSGHPLACAASLATLDLYESEGLFDRARTLSAPFEAVVHELKGEPHVIDIRNLGLVAGIELEPRAGAPGARAMEVFQRCYDTGLLTRVTGDIIALSPPLISETKDFDQMVQILADAITATA